MKNMFAVVLLVLVFSCMGYSGTCDNEKCDEIITSIRMVASLEKKFQNYRTEKEYNKTRQEELIHSLRSELTILEDESKARKIKISALLDTIAKLNSSEGPPGPQGAKGEQGDQGDQGSKGDTGETGITGDIGASITGDAGANGTEGDVGPTGPTGDAGPWPTSCTDADPCISSPCQSGGRCEVVDGGYKCTCPIWRTGSMCETQASCQKVTQCASGVGWINDLHELKDTPDTVLVSGDEGIARCSLNGGSVEIIQKPLDTSKVYSTIVTDAGVMFTIAKEGYDESSSTDKLYYFNRGSWDEVYSRLFNPYKLEINKNGTLMVMNVDRDDKTINSIIYDSNNGEYITETILDFSTATSNWRSVKDFVPLTSGAIVVVDTNNHCAHIIGQEGTLVTTFGQCGSKPQLYFPRSVVIDMFDNLLIAYRNAIKVFTSTGTPVTSVCGYLRDITYALVTSGGYVVTGDENGLVKIYRYT